MRRLIPSGWRYYTRPAGRKGNKSEYILPSLLTYPGLRNAADVRSVFEAKKCGLITTRNDLDQLEILVLGVNAEEGHKNDEDIIKLYLQQWFTEMKVKRFEIYNTDLPENIERRVTDFLDNAQ